MARNTITFFYLRQAKISTPTQLRTNSDINSPSFLQLLLFQLLLLALTMVMLKSLSASMNAKISGTGDEIIVLGHGFGANQYLWEKIVPSLEQKHQVVLFDWNFSGNFNDKVQSNNSFDAIKYDSLYAFADDLLSLMDEMNIKSCVFVGHSMSGMIGCIASIKKPQLFKKLILIGASPR